MHLGAIQRHKGDKQAIDAAKELGLDGIDFDLSMHSVSKEGDLYGMGRDAVIEYFTDVKAYADKVGMTIRQTHGRLYGFGTSPEMTEEFVKNTELDCLASRVLGAKYCVVHTPSVAWVGIDKTDEEMIALCDDLFRQILPMAKREGIKIAAETHGYCNKYQKMEYYGYADNLIKACQRAKDMGYGDQICVCVDTGHTNMTVRHGNLSVGDFIRRAGSLVEVLHLHDNDGVTDQHKIPMTGVIDWNDVLTALEEINYSGWYNLENEMTKFGSGFAMEMAEFSVKLIKYMVNNVASLKR